MEPSKSISRWGKGSGWLIDLYPSVNCLWRIDWLLKKGISRIRCNYFRKVCHVHGVFAQTRCTHKGTDHSGGEGLFAGLGKYNWLVACKHTTARRSAATQELKSILYDGVPGIKDRGKEGLVLGLTMGFPDLRSRLAIYAIIFQYWSILLKKSLNCYSDISKYALIHLQK